MTKGSPRAVLATIFSAILLALAGIGSPLRAAQAAPDPASFDILGMKLGMNVAQIEAAIKAHNPSVEIKITNVPITEVSVGSDQQKPGGGKFIPFVEADSQPPGIYPESISVAFTVTQPSRAFYIRHMKQFPPGQGPSPDKVVQQLREKYGPEGIENFNYDLASHKGSWVFDDAGRPVKNCFTGQYFVYSKYAVQFPVPIPIDVSFFPSQCPIKLAVHLLAYPDTHLLSGLFEELVEHSIAIDDIQKLMAIDDIQKLKAEAKAEQDKQRKQQEQKASGVKPAL